MRIAHIGGGSIPRRLAAAQRQLGHDAIVIRGDGAGEPTRGDERLMVEGGPLAWNAGVLRRVRSFLGFEILHIHGGIGRSQLAWPLLRAATDASVAVHYYPGPGGRPVGLHHQWAADLQFHSAPNLQEWLPRSVWAPDPIEVPPPLAPPDNPIPRFAYFPTSDAGEGTKRIAQLFRRAFGPIEMETRGGTQIHHGRSAELVVRESSLAGELGPLLDGCDVLLDRYSGTGIYTILAVEAMARGMPVVGGLRAAWYDDCPILSIDAQGIEEALRDLARDDDLRRRLGRRGRDYVTRVHDSSRVARRLLKSYYRVRSDPPLTIADTRRYWTRRGGEYFDEFSSRPAQSAYVLQAQELLAIMEPLRSASILELGCGFGRISREVVRPGGRPWAGVDLSRDQLAKARTEESLRRLLVQGSADAIPARTGSFDLVLSVEMLMHIPPESIRTALSEMWRVARKNIVHLDWFEDYMVDQGTGWCWVHDYETLWKRLGGQVRIHPLESFGIQCVFVVEKPAEGPAVPPPNG